MFQLCVTEPVLTSVTRLMSVGVGEVDEEGLADVDAAVRCDVRRGCVARAPVASNRYGG